MLAATKVKMIAVKKSEQEHKAPSKRTQQCWMLHVASVCAPCCMLLRVVTFCWELLRKVWNR